MRGWIICHLVKGRANRLFNYMIRRFLWAE